METYTRIQNIKKIEEIFASDLEKPVVSFDRHIKLTTDTNTIDVIKATRE